VFSDADSESLHVKLSDEAVHIGPPAAQQSYLVKEKLIEAAKRTNCQAIHPGYGFLSESFEFSEMCAQNGIIFIGAPWKAIRDMGIKSTSKHIMSAAKVPIIEGYHGEDQSDARLVREAERVGYPIMIKAVRGGGGKGMRIAFTPAEFLPQLASARTEALKAFNNDDMLVERYVESPRHVEVQVFGDTHGNYVYLYERDCSVQRRHQKIIEEAPGPGITEETRRKIGEAAVKAARAVDYVGAGTVEFIMDPKQSFFFMEMNTRLQVEHPITEMITGTDLVEWQIRVARGEKLPLSQEQIPLKGHAFEARIYAEDPSNNFMPGAGKLKFLQAPSVDANDRANIRVETGVEQGDEVSVHYDPLIAKLVVWSQDRASALQKLRYSLENYQIAGLTTNIPFIMSLADHPEFQAGNVNTDFIPNHKDSLFEFAKQTQIDDEAVCCSLAAILDHEKRLTTQFISSNNCSNLNEMMPNLWTNSSIEREYSLAFNNESKSKFKVRVKFPRANSAEPLRFVINGKEHLVRPLRVIDESKKVFQCEVNGHRQKISYFRDSESAAFNCFLNGRILECTLDTAKFLAGQDSSSSSSTDNLTAHSPMPGVVDRVLVKVGDKVKKGDPLVVMIAMKMEYVIRCAQDTATVATVNCQPGQNVKKAAKLVSLSN